jgi:hypothetical protein
MYSSQGAYSYTISFPVPASLTYHSLINYPTYPISEVTEGIPNSPRVQSSWSPPIVIPINSLEVPFYSPYGKGASFDICEKMFMIPGLLSSISFFCLPLNG